MYKSTTRTTALPIEYVIWNAQECANHLKQTRHEFLRSTRFGKGFPPELVNRPRHWQAFAVMNWKPSTPKPRLACLYRHFDGSGQLLYVGISMTALVRMARHSRDSHWFDLVAKITVERFSTKIEAHAAERAAVKSEHPMFNLWMNRQ